jgi:hypothetical protein
MPTPTDAGAACCVERVLRRGACCFRLGTPAIFPQPSILRNVLREAHATLTHVYGAKRDPDPAARVAHRRTPVSAAYDLAQRTVY